MLTKAGGVAWTQQRRATAQRDREYPPDHPGKLSRRNQPTGPEQGGKLQTREARCWLAVHLFDLEGRIGGSARFDRFNLA